MIILGLGLAAALASVAVVVDANKVANRAEPAAYKVTATITVGRNPTWVAADAGVIWVANHHGASVSRIDPATNKVTATIKVGPSPDGVAVGAGAIWVIHGGSVSPGSVSRIE